jgi:hypothetical protein
MTTTQPTPQQREATPQELEAALELVLANSCTTTEGAHRLGLSAMTLAKRPIKGFKVGRERRYWLHELAQCAS